MVLLRPHRYKFLIVIMCLLVFIVISYKLLNLHSLLETNLQRKSEQKIDDVWSYRLNLTSKFIPITDKEKILFSKLKSIQASCGEVCDTSISSGVMGKYYEQVHKRINCGALFTNPDMDSYSEYETPPKFIPNYLLSEFTHGGKLQVYEEYRDSSLGASQPRIWTKEAVEEHIKQFENGTLKGYGHDSCQNIAWHLDSFIKVKGKSVLVIGSQRPWVESILLSRGAKFITTFDYSQITSEHPQIETIMPVSLAKKYFDGVRYDVVVSYSSLEHSGLGRYGDMLNPWGDLIAMARSWCLVKPGGYGLVGVPAGPDRIGFNSHRIYGPLAFAQLFSNWEQVYTETDFSKYNPDRCWWCYQPIHSLRRI